ncbi:class I SAM-dependent methyltransferase [Actinoplanes sp. M2I2]|uniref:class I SAM-dependent methyltransferase n=1 Tax=Actinoplanes sp. M2I2 TaxID=1734444 RepID=UPI0020215635|nr:class I SAM-dependent methyltransferase [Actinoplanes sp. M2I2]
MRAEQSGPRQPARDSAYFDRWYAEMEASPAKDAILRRHLDLPADLGSAGVVPWEALDEIAQALRMPTDGLLVDVACGRGGYGIEIAKRSGTRLIGVDFSAVALRDARRIAARRLGPGRAEFRVGVLTDLDLPTGVADAIMCTDSVQFADPPAAALSEFRRVLAGGGRLALTTWQPTSPGDPRVVSRLRNLDLRRELESAGFHHVVVEQRLRWRAAERGAYEEAVATVDDGRDPALASLREEGRRALDSFETLQRIVAYATAP